MAEFKTNDLIKGLQSAIKSANKFLEISEQTNKQIEETAKNISTVAGGLDLASATGLKEFNKELEKTNKLVELKAKNDKEAIKVDKELLQIENALNKAIAEEEKANQQKLRTKKLIRDAEIKEIKVDKELLQMENALNKAIAEEEKANQQKLRTKKLIRDAEIKELKEKQRLITVQKREKQRLITVQKRETKEIERANAAKEKAEQKAKHLNSAYGKLTAATNKAQRELKELSAEFGVNSVQAEKARKKFDALDKKLREINDSANDGRRDVGRYSDALQGVLGGDITALLGGAGLATAGLIALNEAYQALSEMVKETNAEIKQTADVTNLTGQALDDITSKIKATASTFEKDYKEVLMATNTVAKEFGISQSEALDVVNDGFVNGLDASGEYLDNIREYSTQFSQAGLTAKEFNQITQLGLQEGIFSDKALDVVKEGGIRLREYTKATQDAIKPLGDLRVQQIENAVASGDTFKAIQLVSDGLEEVALTASEKGTIIADVFGGAGEDAGLRYIEMLGDVNTEQSTLNGTLTKAQEIMQNSLKANERLANAQIEISKSLQGVNGSLDVFTTNLEATGLEIFLFLINEIKGVINDLSPIFDELTNAWTELSNEFESATGSSGWMSKFLKFIFRSTSGLTTLKISLSAVFTALTWFANGVTKVIRLLKEGYNSAKDFALSFDFIRVSAQEVKDVFDGFIQVMRDSPRYMNAFVSAFKETFTQLKNLASSTFKSLGDGITGVFTLDRAKLKQAIKGLSSGFSEAGEEIAAAWLRGFNQKIEEETEKEEGENNIVNTIKKAVKKQFKKGGGESSSGLGASDLGASDLLSDLELLQLKQANELLTKKLQYQKLVNEGQMSDAAMQYELNQLMQDHLGEINEQLEKEKELAKTDEEKLKISNKILDNEIKIAELKKDATIDNTETTTSTDDSGGDDDDDDVDILKRSIEESINLIESLYDKAHEKRMSQLEAELEQNLRNQEIIKEGIENGSELAEQSLAVEKRIQAEREAEIQRLEQKALKLNALIALLQVWGETGNLAETLTGFTALQSAASQVQAGFYEGTDEVGSTGSEVKHSNGRDGYIAKLDKGEMVFNSKQSDELRGLGFTTRDSMLDLARMAEMGVQKGGGVVAIKEDNSILVEQLKEQNELLKKLPKLMPVHNRGLTDNPKYVQEIFKTGNVTNKVKRRARGSWQS